MTRTIDTTRYNTGVAGAARWWTERPRWPAADHGDNRYLIIEAMSWLRGRPRASTGVRGWLPVQAIMAQHRCRRDGTGHKGVVSGDLETGAPDTGRGSTRLAPVHPPPAADGESALPTHPRGESD